MMRPADPSVAMNSGSQVTRAIRSPRLSQSVTPYEFIQKVDATAPQLDLLLVKSTMRVSSDEPREVRNDQSPYCRVNGGGQSVVTFGTRERPGYGMDVSSAKRQLHGLTRGLRRVSDCSHASLSTKHNNKTPCRGSDPSPPGPKPSSVAPLRPPQVTMAHLAHVRLARPTSVPNAAVEAVIAVETRNGIRATPR
jgi:hypothetical protein